MNDPKLAVRPIRLLDVPRWLKWLWDGKEKNALSPKMFDYPKLKVIVCERDGEPTMFTPVHEVLMIDSAAFSPNSDAEIRLLSAKQTIQNVIDAARQDGFGEIIYVCSDGRSDEFMEKHFQFTRVAMMRKVL